MFSDLILFCINKLVLFFLSQLISHSSLIKDIRMFVSLFGIAQF